jgi:hypothetical protein
MKYLPGLCGALLFVIMAVAILMDKPEAPACPLKGCNCGTICTRTFDCVRGKHVEPSCQMAEGLCP